MDKNVAYIEKKRAEKVMEHLRPNRMDAYYAENSAQALSIIKDIIPEGAVCRVGGSQTLHETGVIELLENGDYNFRDSHAASPKEVEAVRREAFSADYFLASANAITEDGKIYNVDGIGTRVAPIIFGPENVILVVGTNKIVANMDEAVYRLEHLAAPANATRIGCDTPCTKLGFCAHCKTAGRICCSYTVLSYQRIPGRIKVIIVGEHLGY